jgi:hypothetical protein
MESKTSASINPSFFGQFFKWWFSVMPKNIFLAVRQTVANTYDYFSIGLLAKTLLAPWKRDVISMEHLTLGERLQIVVMNLVSRLIGAFIRFITIMAGLITIIGELIFGIFIFAGFILLPLLAILIFISAFL